MNLLEQTGWLFLLSLPVACISWTFTHEEVFREPYEFFVRRSQSGSRLGRKFFYMLTCEYCFSHYVALAMIIITGFRLLLADWRGFIIAWFSVVWIANAYMNLYGLIRQDIKREKTEIKMLEKEAEE